MSNVFVYPSPETYPSEGSECGDVYSELSTIYRNLEIYPDIQETLRPLLGRLQRWTFAPGHLLTLLTLAALNGRNSVVVGGLPSEDNYAWVQCSLVSDRPLPIDTAQQDDMPQYSTLPIPGVRLEFFVSEHSDFHQATPLFWMENRSQPLTWIQGEGAYQFTHHIADNQWLYWDEHNNQLNSYNDILMMVLPTIHAYTFAPRQRILTPSLRRKETIEIAVQCFQASTFCGIGRDEDVHELAAVCQLLSDRQHLPSLRLLALFIQYVRIHEHQYGPSEDNHLPYHFLTPWPLQLQTPDGVLQFVDDYIQESDLARAWTVDGSVIPWDDPRFTEWLSATVNMYTPIFDGLIVEPSQVLDIAAV